MKLADSASDLRKIIVTRVLFPAKYYKIIFACLIVYLNMWRSIESATVSSSVKRIECYSGCSTCRNTSENGCLTCEEGLLYWEGQCLERCPEGSYQNSTDCLACPPECKRCSSPLECIEYASNKKCVNDCPSGLYMDNLSGKCSKCDKACSTCYGPSGSECAECNVEEGYVKANKLSGECHLLTCPEGTFLNHSTQTNETQCSLCHYSCSTCSGSELFNCLSCSEEFIFNKTLNSQEGICQEHPEESLQKINGKLVGNSFKTKCREVWGWIKSRNQ